MKKFLTIAACLMASACASNGAYVSWQVVVEFSDGSSQIVDYDLSFDDCDKAADKAIVDYPQAPVIYCEAIDG